MEKYGFVYIWFDRKHKRYYIGSHWGTEDDGYICSSRWMRNSFKRRPQDFKRRLLTIVPDRAILIQEEQRWLDFIDSHKIGIKYYNLNKYAVKHWHTDDNLRLTVGQKIAASPNRKTNISKANKGKIPPPHVRELHLKSITGRVQSDEEKKKRIESRKWYKHSEETKKKMSFPKQKVTCPHCEKVGGLPAMKKHHFNMCRHKYSDA